MTCGGLETTRVSRRTAAAGVQYLTHSGAGKSLSFHLRLFADEHCFRVPRKADGAYEKAASWIGSWHCHTPVWRRFASVMGRRQASPQMTQMSANRKADKIRTGRALGMRRRVCPGIFSGPAFTFRRAWSYRSAVSSFALIRVHSRTGHAFAGTNSRITRIKKADPWVGPWHGAYPRNHPIPVGQRP